jgi:hypothetical protein
MHLRLFRGKGFLNTFLLFGPLFLMGCQDIEPEEPEQDLTSTSFEETSSALNNNPAP